MSKVGWAENIYPALCQLMPSSSETILKTTNLIKTFGNRQALAGLDMEIKAGENFGLIGPAAFYGKTFQMLRVKPWKDAATGQVFLEVAGPQEEFCKFSPADEPVSELLKGSGALTARASQGGSAAANLNLEGTNFHLREGLVFGIEGNINGYNDAADISPNRENLDVTLTPNSQLVISSDQGATVLPVSPILLEHD